MEIPCNFVEVPFTWQVMKEFSNRTRAMEILIKNNSSIVLNLDGEYFDSGARFQSLFGSSIQPNSKWLTFIANKEPSAFCGVTGGVKYRLGGTDICLYLGFTNPRVGSYKCFVSLTEEVHTAKWGYDQAQEERTQASLFNDFSATAMMTDAKYCRYKRIVFKIEHKTHSNVIMRSPSRVELQDTSSERFSGIRYFCVYAVVCMIGIAIAMCYRFINWVN